MKLYYIMPEGGSPPLFDFIDALDVKLRQKLLRQFALLITAPMPREPDVKHFKIQRYSKLYELRTRSKIMIRIIFTIREDGDILFLTPFVKKQSRDTMQALDASLKLLERIDDGTWSISELTVNKILEKGAVEK